MAIWSSATGEALLRERDEQPGWASFPRTSPSREPSITLATYRSDGTVGTIVEVPELPVAHPLVNALSDGSFVIAGARCYWREQGPEMNALIISADGTLLRRGCLGDGIEHLLVGAQDTIWTGYFDEGVFGNYGWGSPGPTPLGVSGIAAWSTYLDKSWELDPQEGLVSDCYALNVDADVVWACPYTDFPVVRIEHGSVQVFATTDVTGARGIIASDDQVGLVGTYGDPSLLVLGGLVDGRFVETDRLHLWAPDGSPLPRGKMHCRGSLAHFFVGTRWYSFDLQDASR